ncbi:hypothetical protein SO694_000056115 [Aureococcus anophagefferens]|uniref:Thiaminase-2/PQQC domain-containing protein n=1 Tax=Aureococcus anophagefferens TaxID=44056 RepID=A0ABR1GAK2_AURAN
MLRAAVATMDASLRVSVERTAFFLNPQLGAATGETMASLFKRYYGDKKAPASCSAASSSCSAVAASSCSAEPPRSSDKLKVHAAKADADAQALRTRHGLAALEDGVAPMHYDYDVVMSSSLDAQRLLLWIGSDEARRSANGGPAARERYFEELVSEHFARKGVYSDRAMLVRCAERAGVDAKRCEKYLASGRDEDAIRQQFLRVFYGYGEGFSSIPITMFASAFACEGQDYVIRGSSHLEDYVEVLRLCAAQPPSQSTKKPAWEDLDAKAKLAGGWDRMEQRVFGQADAELYKQPADR